MDAKSSLEAYCKKVEPLIAEFFESVAPDAKAVYPDATKALDRLEEFTLRKAKRVRSALMYYTYLMMGGKQAKEILKTSVFIEILHAYLLIHDDVMDQDPTRRGKPTMHKIYQNDHKHNYEHQDPKHFGESMAINVGDIGCHLALQALVDSKFPAELKIKAISKLHKQITGVGYGQMLDVLGTARNGVDEEYVMMVHKYKTAKYTYETPISIGAILAGANDKDVKTLSDYAIPAGIAFQIQDDILGMFGSEEKLGKPNTSDLREGKRTLLIIKALEKANKKQILTLSRALGNPNVNFKTAETARQIIIDTGSLEYSKKTALKYVYEAKDALAKMPDWDGVGREFLDGIADYMINREF